MFLTATEENEEDYDGPTIEQRNEIGLVEER
jgi:hypothetical protein